jgi:drug/metabolite transporter (DMT)-like permease
VSVRWRGSPALWCLAAAALFGASTPAAKLLLGPIGPFSLAGLLYLGAGLAVLPWAWRPGNKLPRPDRKNLVRLAGAVLFGGVAGPVLLLWGLSLAPAGSVALWLNLESVATALLAWIMFREHVGGRAWLATAIVCAASLLLASPAGFDLGPAAVLVALACIAWGLDNNFTAIIDGLTPAQSTLAKGIVAGVVNLGLGLALEQPSFALAGLGGALAVGAASYGLSLVLYIGGAQQLGATRSQLIFSTAPLWGLVLAWTWLREPILSTQIFAALLMATAIWLLRGERHAHRHAHERVTHTHWHRHDDGHHEHEHGTPVAPGTAHSHEHAHQPVEHEHPHRPDLHHRHRH